MNKALEGALVGIASMAFGLVVGYFLLAFVMLDWPTISAPMWRLVLGIEVLAAAAFALEGLARGSK